MIGDKLAGWTLAAVGFYLLGLADSMPAPAYLQIVPAAAAFSLVVWYRRSADRNLVAAGAAVLVLIIAPQLARAWAAWAAGFGVETGLIGRYGDLVIGLGAAGTALLFYRRTGALVGRGYRFFEQGRFTEAIGLYDLALKISPKNALAWCLKGYSYGYLGQSRRAISSFSRSIELEPERPDAWCGMGLALVEAGDYENAAAAFDRAIEFDHLDLAEVIALKANTLAELGKHEEALDYYDRSIALRPEDADAWFNKSVCLSQLGRHESAIEAIDRAIAVNAFAMEAWDYKGFVLQCLGRHKEAARCFHRAKLLSD